MTYFKLLLADDHPIVLQGMVSYLKGIGYSNVQTYTNGIEAYNAIIQLKPNISILDLDMPGMSGIEIAEKVLSMEPRNKIILMTMHKELSLLKKCQEIGVMGYVLKEFALKELEKCLQEVFQGQTYYSPELQKNMIIDEMSANELNKLTTSERKILKLIGERKSTKDIAVMLFISEKTIEKHRSNIIRKLNLPQDRRSLIELGIRNFGKI